MINFKNSDFCKLLRLCAISALQISKKHFATFDFFVKMKLVSTVWVSTSLSKLGYYQGVILNLARVVLNLNIDFFSFAVFESLFYGILKFWH